jgi:DNA-binding CsgD family transcriptional regulator
VEEALTPREAEIAKLVADGKTNAEIAETLGVSVFTIGNHMVNIFDKLRLRNRVELVNYWTKLQAV